MKFLFRGKLFELLKTPWMKTLKVQKIWFQIFLTLLISAVMKSERLIQNLFHILILVFRMREKDFFINDFSFFPQIISKAFYSDRRHI